MGACDRDEPAGGVPDCLFLSSLEHASLLRRGAQTTGRVWSVYQDPRYLAARASIGDDVVIVGHTGPRATSVACVREGDVFVGHEASLEREADVRSFVRSIAKASGVPVRVTYRTAIATAHLPESGYATVVVMVRRPEVLLLQQMQASTRRAIQRARKAPLQVRWARDPSAVADLDSFVNGMTSVQHRGGLDTDVFVRRLDSYLRHGVATVITVSLDDWVVAGACLLVGGGIANLRYTFASRDLGLRPMRPGNLLMWSAMMETVARNCHWCDLSGVTMEGANGSPSGIDRFKQGFGGEVWAYAEAYDEPSPRPTAGLWPAC